MSNVDPSGRRVADDYGGMSIGATILHMMERKGDFYYAWHDDIYPYLDRMRPVSDVYDPVSDPVLTKMADLFESNYNWNAYAILGGIYLDIGLWKLDRGVSGYSSLMMEGVRRTELTINSTDNTWLPVSGILELCHGTIRGIMFRPKLTVPNKSGITDVPDEPQSPSPRPKVGSYEGKPIQPPKPGTNDIFTDYDLAEGHVLWELKTASDAGPSPGFKGSNRPPAQQHDKWIIDQMDSTIANRVEGRKYIDDAFYHDADLGWRFILKPGEVYNPAFQQAVSQRVEVYRILYPNVNFHLEWR